MHIQSACYTIQKHTHILYCIKENGEFRIMILLKAVPFFNVYMHQIFSANHFHNRTVCVHKLITFDMYQAFVIFLL